MTKNEGDLRPKNEDHIKNEDGLKNEYNLKKCPPSPFLKNYLKFFLMTSDLNSHTTTDIELEMLSGNGIP